jgi:hypothetical protein
MKLTADNQRTLCEALDEQSALYGGEAGLRETVAAIGVPFDDYLARKKSDMLVGTLLLNDCPRPTLEDRRSYFRAHPDDWAGKSMEEVNDAINARLWEKALKDYIARAMAETPSRVSFP